MAQTGEPLKTFLQQQAFKLFALMKKNGVIINNHTQNKDQVRLQIDLLGPFFDFIHHDDLPERLTRKHSKPFCLLTFDDGKKINAVESASELERAGVPAVFYLTTDCVNNQKPHWFDFRDALKQKCPILPDHVAAHTLKRLSMAQISQRIENTCREFNVQPDLSDPLIAPMDWADVCDLDKKGFTIGSHSTMHEILTNETATDVFRDIKQSIKDVSFHLGKQCPTFAFPNGNYTLEMANYATQCGVKTVMTTDPLWLKPGTPLNRLPRIQLYNRYSKDQILMKIMAALPGFLLKNPNGQGRRYVINKSVMHPQDPCIDHARTD